ncbi:MAG: hypothetical protein QOD75_262 [Blastocatellia bacterium]|jgi:photosystem II stability/assembly factor-like uncharacterized protein|nr:hypothetical protein [Blastocatellia bacterium]
MITPGFLSGFKTPAAKALRLFGLAAASLFLAVVVFAQTGWTGHRIGPAGKDLNAVYFADSKLGWIGGDDGFISHTEDGGQSWNQQSVGTSKAISDIYFSGNDTGFLLAGDEVFSTTDGGRNWKSQRRFLPSEFEGAEPELYSVRFAGKKRGWVVGSLSRKDKVVESMVFFTDDQGVSWRRQNVPTREELLHLDFIDDKRGWIVGASGTILHTENGGDSWASQKSGVTRRIYHVDFRNEKEGWAAGGRGTLLRTTNGGNNWTAVESNTRASLLSVQFVSDKQGWVSGYDGVILRSEDGGQTWIKQATPTDQNLYALFVGKKTGWAVGGDGFVLRYER